MFKKILPAFLLIAQTVLAGNPPPIPGPPNSPIIYANGCAYDLISQACIASAANTVSSFNGRVGVVTSQLSDYSAYFLQLSGGTLTGAIQANGELTLNPAMQTGNNDAATIAQLAAFAAGAEFKPIPAFVATTANITLSGEQTIDTFLTSASRVLVKNQTIQSQNGIYLSGAGAWTRTTDANTSGLLTSAAIIVSNGSVASGQAGTSWVQTTSSPTIGTSPIVWTNLGITYTADEVTLHQTGSVFSIKTGGISNAQVSSSAAIAGSKISPQFGAQIASSQSVSANGTGGLGFLNLAAQSSAPTNPSGSAFNIYADNIGGLVFQNSSVNTEFLFSGLTANRSFAFPDLTGTLLTNNSTAALTNKTISSTTDKIGGVTMALGSDNLGDMYYANAFNVLTRLPGNSTSTTQFLQMTGTGASPNPPSWGTIATAALPTSGVTAGSYTAANITVNAQGQVTTAANGAPSSINSSSLVFDDFNRAGTITSIFGLGSPSGTGGFTQVNPTATMGWRPGIAQINSQTIGGRYGIALTNGIVPGQNVASYTAEYDVEFPTVVNFYPVIGFISNYTFGSSSNTAAFTFNNDTISANATTTNGSNVASSVTARTSAFTGNIVSGSPTVSAVSSFSGINIGNSITGSGIPVGVFIIGYNSGASTITMSANATANTNTLAISSANQSLAYTYIGASISGPGIPGGTTITGFGVNSYIMSANAGAGAGVGVITMTNDGKWQCVNGTASFRVNCGSALPAVAVNTWYKLDIALNAAGTHTVYSINGVQVLDQTSGFPNGATTAQAEVVTTLAATSNNMLLDYASFLTNMVTGR